MNLGFNLKSDFFRSVLLITSGTVLAQVIGYLLAPIITRLYSPEEMGEFGFYFRIVTLIATLATARFEMALPLPKNDHHSFQLFRLALRITFFTSIITLAFALVYMAWMSFEPIAMFMGLAVVAGTFFLVFFNLGTNWAVRKKAFRNISFSKVSNSLVMNGLRVILGLFQPGTYALVLSFIVSLVVASYFFFVDFYKNSKEKINARSLKRMRVLLSEYKDFPRVNLPHGLMDAARDVFLALIIVEFFSEDIFGSFDHSLRMLRLPLMVIGISMSQVFFNRVSELKNSNQTVLPLVKKIFVYLTLISIVPFALIFFFGEPIFAFVFGEEWRQSGILSQIMAPWLMFNFIASPMTALPIVLGKQKQFFFIGLTSSLFQLSGFGLLPLLIGNDEQSMYTIFAIVSLAQSLLSIYVVIFTLKIARNSDRTRIA